MGAAALMRRIGTGTATVVLLFAATAHAFEPPTNYQLRDTHMQMLESAVAGSPAEELPEWVSDLPFPPEFELEKVFLLEVNGFPFFQASGRTHVRPPEFAAGIKEAFPEEYEGSKRPILETDGAFWQILDLRIPNRKETMQAFKDMSEEATGHRFGEYQVIAEGVCALMGACAAGVLIPIPEVKRAFYRLAFPPLWIVDMLCQTRKEQTGWCHQGNPVETIRALLEMMPDMSFHSITWRADGEGTRFEWSVVRSLQPKGLFNVFNDPFEPGGKPGEPCPDDGALRWPAGTHCMLTINLVSRERSGAVYITRMAADAATVTNALATELEATGWKPLELFPAEQTELFNTVTGREWEDAMREAQPDFRMYERWGRDAFLSVSEQQTDYGLVSTALFIATGSDDAQ